jgi:hypothetical protein
MKHPQNSKASGAVPAVRLTPVAWASSVALLTGAAAVHAQTPPANAASAPQALETVVITGIRKSLDSAVTLKRESRGLVDGIVAEDIGKFPDTNLAESMQRIAGVSIDRSASGEGSKVTVRGVGPDFNMVLLNGRQMPTAVIGWEGAGANGSRAFDFANLSSDSISALEVYKTARAESPTGGIGATINVKTARPLDVRERIASIGVKANYDASTGRLPGPLQGDKVTPEISGIYSDTFGNRTLGISISGSYSKRDSGSNKAYTQNGWGTNDPAVKAANPASNIVNMPTGLYATSRELRYSLTGMERERLNGQATLQFAPTKDLKFTVDHTMAVNTLSSKNAEMSSWFNNSFRRSERQPGDHVHEGGRRCAHRPDGHLGRHARPGPQYRPVRPEVQAELHRLQRRLEGQRRVARRHRRSPLEGQDHPGQPVRHIQRDGPGDVQPGQRHGVLRQEVPDPAVARAEVRRHQAERDRHSVPQQPERPDGRPGAGARHLSPGRRQQAAGRPGFHEDQEPFRQLQQPEQRLERRRPHAGPVRRYQHGDLQPRRFLQPHPGPRRSALVPVLLHGGLREPA